MPKYLIKIKGKHIDYVSIPKKISQKNKAKLAHNRRTIFKGYREVTAPSWKQAVIKVAGRKISWSKKR